MTTATGIFFTEEKNGYDREQVDGYIHKLSEAYQKAFSEYEDLRGKYNSLLEDCKNLDLQERTGLNSDIIAKTLIHTELLAQKIIEGAHAEAAKVKSDAKIIINQANAEAAKVKAEAQKAVDEAHSEAAKIGVRARRNHDEAQKVLAQAANEVQKLLASNNTVNITDITIAV
jgi:cell division septum initiation protein DivIVA